MSADHLTRMKGVLGYEGNGTKLESAMENQSRARSRSPRSVHTFEDQTGVAWAISKLALNNGDVSSAAAVRAGADIAVSHLFRIPQGIVRARACACARARGNSEER